MKKPNPFLTHMAKTGAGAGAGVPTQTQGQKPVADPIDTVPDTPQNVMELAMFDTTEMKAIAGEVNRSMVVAEKFIIQEASQFRHIADDLDRRISGDERLDVMELAVLRNHVQSLMISVVRNPDLESVMLDKDVRNCIIFAQLTHANTQVMDMAKTQKSDQAKASARGKKMLSAEKASAFAKGLDDLLGGGF